MFGMLKSMYKDYKQLKGVMPLFAGDDIQFHVMVLIFSIGAFFGLFRLVRDFLHLISSIVVGVVAAYSALLGASFLFCAISTWAARAGWIARHPNVEANYNTFINMFFLGTNEEISGNVASRVLSPGRNGRGRKPAARG